jgi:peroxiredoxin
MSAATVYDEHGAPFALAGLWRERRIVLCFLRQLGCRFCMDRTRRVMAHAERLRAAQVALVLVGLGTSRQARRFRDRTGFDGELYVDPSSDGHVKTALQSTQAVAYQYMGLRRGVAMVRNPHTREIGARLADGGTMDWSDLVEGADRDEDDDGKVLEWAGDPFQVGGTFVLGAGNTCDFVHRSQYAGDHPPMADLLAAATGKTASGIDTVYAATESWARRLSMSVPYSGGDGGDGAGSTKKGRCPVILSATPTPDNTTEPTHRARSASARSSSSSTVGFPGAVAMVGVGAAAVAAASVLFLSNKLSNKMSITAGGGRAGQSLSGPQKALLLAVPVCCVLYYSAFGRGGPPASSKANTAKGPTLAHMAEAEAAAVASDACDTCGAENKTSDPNTDALLARLRFAGQGVDFIKVTEIDRRLESLGFHAFSDTFGENIRQASTAKDSQKLTVGAAGHRRMRSQTWDASLGVNEYGIMLQYIRKFLAKSHPDVGRSGPVCPFVPKSLRKDALHLCIMRTGAGKSGDEMHQVRDDIIAFLESFAPVFSTMEPTKGAAQQFKAAIFIFPDIPLDQTELCIDGVQSACKPFFVRRGLMLGEFHLRNNSPGLRNEAFFPLRTPIPCLAVRHMVPTDLAFLDVSKYEPETRVAFLESFLDVFGEDKVYKNAPEIVAAGEALEAGKAELEGE